MTSIRVTVTLPAELVEEVDRLERNRSRFVLEGVRREVQRRRREELRRSLSTPHPESLDLADEGLASWHERLPEEDASGLVDLEAGTAVRWRVGEGWLPDEDTDFARFAGLRWTNPLDEEDQDQSHSVDGGAE